MPVLSDFGFVSNFDIRASNFPFGAGRELALVNFSEVDTHSGSAYNVFPSFNQSYQNRVLTSVSGTLRVSLEPVAPGKSTTRRKNRGEWLSRVRFVHLDQY